MTDNPLFRQTRDLVITGVGPDDDTFSGEFAGRFYTYNVTKACRDCLAGKHGAPYGFDVVPAYEASKTVEVEEDKVQRFMRSPQILRIPLVLVIEHGAAWLIEGHHRLRALYRLNVQVCYGYVIEEAVQQQYLVLFNGSPEMPEALRHPDIIGRAEA